MRPLRHGGSHFVNPWIREWIYVSHLSSDLTLHNSCLKFWLKVDMSRCIKTNDKISTMSKLDFILHYSLHTCSNPDTDTDTDTDTVHVLAWNGMCRIYIGFVLYMGWRYKNDTAQYSLFTTGIEQYHFSSEFYCITKNWANRVLFSYTIPGIVLKVKEQYRDVLQNDTVCYCYNIYGTGTIPDFA